MVIPAMAPWLRTCREGVEGDGDDVTEEDALVGTKLVNVTELVPTELVPTELADEEVVTTGPGAAEVVRRPVDVDSTMVLRNNIEVGDASQDQDDQVLVSYPVGMSKWVTHALAL